MNKNDRKQVSKWVEQLESIKSSIEEMQETEQDKFDNLPEGLQESERGEAIEEAVSQLEEAVDNINEAIDNLQEIAE